MSSQRRIRPSPTLPPDLLDWHQTPPSPPYTCPGEFYTDSAKDKVVVPDSPLYRLLTAHPLREATKPYWTLLLGRAAGRPTSHHLAELQQRLFKVLLPGLSDNDLLEAVTRLHAVCHPSGPISYWELHRHLTNLADAWVPGFDSKDFASFLSRLFTRVTMRVVQRAGGSQERKLPSLMAVFMRSPGNPLFSGWTEVREGEAYSDLYVYRSMEDAKGQRKRVKKLKTDLGPQDSTQCALEDDILYDEVIENEEEDCDYELLDLRDVVPLGDVAEAYLAHLKFKTKQKAEENRGRAISVMENERKRDSTPVGVYGQVLDSSFPSSPDSSFEEQESLFPEFEWEDDVQIGRAGGSSGSALVTDSVRQFLRDRLEKGAVMLHKTEAVQVGSGFQASSTYFPSDRMYDLQITLLATKKTHRRFQTPLEALRFLSLPRRKHEGEDLFSMLLSLLRHKYAGKKPKMTVKNQPEDRDDVGTVARFLGLSRDAGESQAEAVDGYFDVVEEANRPVYKILIVGKPRSGKSAVASLLCAQMQLRHIECGLLLEAVVAKAAAPPDDDADPDQPPAPRLSPVEQSALEELLAGSELSDSSIAALLKAEIALPAIQGSGFVLDLPWTNVQVMEILKELQCEFTHVLELCTDDSDLEVRLREVRQDPHSGKLYTTEDVQRFLHPPPPQKPVRDVEDEEEEEDEVLEDEEEQETVPPTLPLQDFVQRPEDDPLVLEAQWHTFDTRILQEIRDFVAAMPDETIVTVQAAGLRVEECVQAARVTLRRETQRAVRLNSEAEMRDLMVQGLKEGEDPRVVSPWRKYDPVALFENELIEGLPEFAADYCSRVFLFKSEDTLTRFLAFPQQYLRSAPALPDYRVLIVGAEGVGKHTQAEMLSAKYGWRVVDAENVLEQAIRTQETDRPSHPDSGLVQLSAQEFAGIMSGKQLPSTAIFPLLLRSLNIPLQKKPPELPPEGEQPEGDDPQADAPKDVGDSEAHSSEAQDEVDTNLKKQEIGIAFSEAQTTADTGLPTYEEGPKVIEPIVYEDLPLAEIVRKVGTDPKEGLGSFVVMGFPGSEEDIEAIKTAKIDFHKVIYLTASEELLQARDCESNSWPSKSLETSDRIFSLLKDTFGEDHTVEIPAAGSVAEVFQRIVLAIDPFADRIDSEDLVTAAEDRPPLPGLTGPFDSVLMKNEGWLIPGNKENKLYFRGKEYLFNSPKEMETFEKNPGQYFTGWEGNWSPHVMVMGARGAGVKTQAQLLATQLQLPVIDLRTALLSSLEQAAKDRRHLRYLLKGFRAPEDSAETGLYVLPEEQDLEIAEEDPDFDRQAEEVNTVRAILDEGPAVIMGSWVDIGEKVSTPLPELLFLAHRLPEVVAYLVIEDKALVSRNLDTQTIVDAHEAALAALREEKAKRRAEALAAQDPDDPVDIPEEEDDESQLPSLATRMEEAKAALTTRKSEDTAALEDVKAGFEDKGIRVEVINANEEVEIVRKQIRYAFKEAIDNRENAVLNTVGKRVTKKKAEALLRTGKAKLSLFGLCSAVTPLRYMREDRFPVLYRERIYYCRDAQEQQEFLTHIATYTQCSKLFPAVPALLPTVAVIGPPHSGVSSLSAALSARYSLVNVRPKDAINAVLATDCTLSQRLTDELTSGKPLSDDIIVECVLFRLRMADARSAGFVLEGFPRTQNQALALVKAGIVVHPVIHLLGKQSGGMEKFKAKREVVEQRMRAYQEVCGMSCWLQTVWDSVHYLPTGKSKWFSIDFASECVDTVFAAKLRYLQRRSQPRSLQHAGFPRLVTTRNIGKWRRYDPVAWRLRNVLESVDTDECALCHDGKSVFFTNGESQSSYCEKPEMFTPKLKPLPDARPLPLTLAECASVCLSEVQLDGHCACCLKHSGKLVPGSLALIVAYESKLFALDEPAHVRQFMQTPWKFAAVKMPLKHVKKPTLLNKIADFEAGVSYLEQHLGVALMKSMMETAALRLLYPGLSIKETALKLVAICLKAGNPRNSEYTREKYMRKMREFRRACDTQVYFVEQAKTRLERVTERLWVDEKFYRAADELQDVETGMIAEGPRFFNRFMR